MPISDDFLPEELEAQNEGLITLLEEFYQQPTLIEEVLSQAEQQRILVETRAFLREMPAVQQREPLPLPIVLLTKQELLQPSLPVAHEPRRLFGRRLLNTLAAFLIVGVLVASSVFLFARQHAPASVGGPPPATMSCLPADSIAGVGLDYICAQHLYEDLHIMQSSGAYRITITKGYADQGQALVWYQVEEKFNGQYQLLAPDTVEMSGGSYGIYERNTLLQPVAMPGIIGWTLSPDPSLHNTALTRTVPIKIQLTQLMLHDAHDDANTIHNVPVSFSFSFNLIAYGSLRQAILQQTQVAHGYSLTLYSVSYSLSLVNVALEFPYIEDTFVRLSFGVPIVTTFKVGKINCVLNPQSRFAQGSAGAGPYEGELDVGGLYGTYPLFQNLNCSLPGEGIAPGSEVTLVLSLYSNQAISDPSLLPYAVWTFHFPLP